jgi:hypothetical protein
VYDDDTINGCIKIRIIIIPTKWVIKILVLGLQCIQGRPNALNKSVPYTLLAVGTSALCLALRGVRPVMDVSVDIKGAIRVLVEIFPDRSRRINFGISSSAIKELVKVRLGVFAEIGRL